MNELGPTHLPWVTWELLGTRHHELLVKESPEELLGQLDRIELSRDEHYNIQALGSGAPDFKKIQSRPAPVAGSEMLPISVQALDELHRPWELAHCRPRGHTTGHRKIGGQTIPTWSVSLRPWTVTRRQRDVGTERVVASLTDWLINAPGHTFIYTRSLEWHSDRTFRRHVQDEPSGSATYGPYTAGSYFDCALVSFGDRKLLVYPLPQESGPPWSNNIGIEYRTEWGGIPDEGQRRAIARIIGYVVGRHLLRVGTTVFDLEGALLEANACNPGTFNARRLCEASDDPPIPIVPFVHGTPAEERDEDGQLIPKLELILGDLIPRYLEARKTVDLDKAIDRYLALREIYGGLDLPVMRSILEVLARSWLKATGSSMGGTYLMANEIDELIGPELASIANKLSDRPYKDSVMQRIRGAFEVSMTAGFYRFLDGIGLPYGEVEKDAIKVASQGAHTLSMNTDEEISFVHQRRNALRSLLDRVILKLLNYDGEYIDYSTLGWPPRHIDLPLKGPVGVATPDLD